MVSLLISVTLFIVRANSCSMPMPQEGKYYISNPQLLSDTFLPDSMLLTIRKTSGFNTAPATNSGPWCKIMNVLTGSVSDVVPCEEYSSVIREYAKPDPVTITTSCSDDCNGHTATCTFTKNGITYTLNDIPYLKSSLSCTTTPTKPISIGGDIFIAFTISNNDILTTYISFETNMVGIEWYIVNDIPLGYRIYNVERIGDWSALIPGGFFSAINSEPSIYSDVSIIKLALPCCLCYSYELNMYDITTNIADMTQIFTLTDLGYGGGQIDAMKSRVFNNGLFYSDTIKIYDLSQGGAVNSFTPDLCNFMATCNPEPCSHPDISCPYNPNARCVNDHCGGCNARWFCGEADITNLCHSGSVSQRTCPHVHVLPFN